MLEPERYPFRCHAPLIPLQLPVLKNVGRPPVSVGVGPQWVPTLPGLSTWGGSSSVAEVAFRRDLPRGVDVAYMFYLRMPHCAAITGFMGAANSSVLCRQRSQHQRKERPYYCDTYVIVSGVLTKQE